MSWVELMEYLKGCLWRVLAGVIAAIVLMGLIFLLAGCTDRFRYRHTWTDPNEVQHVIAADYAEGVGNSDKQSITLVLGDGAYISIGRSVTDQEAAMAVLARYGGTLEQIAAAWMAAGL